MRCGNSTLYPTRWQQYWMCWPPVAGSDNCDGACTQAGRRRLLSFVTGSGCAPVRGLGALTITLVRGSGGPEDLPTAHTCFNQLVLPEYASGELLRAKLAHALEYADAFGMA
jgi:hypothetical protein